MAQIIVGFATTALLWVEAQRWAVAARALSAANKRKPGNVVGGGGSANRANINVVAVRIKLMEMTRTMRPA